MNKKSQARHLQIIGAILKMSKAHLSSASVFVPSRLWEWGHAAQATIWVVLYLTLLPTTHKSHIWEIFICNFSILWILTAANQIRYFSSIWILFHCSSWSSELHLIWAPKAILNHTCRFNKMICIDTFFFVSWRIWYFSCRPMLRIAWAPKRKIGPRKNGLPTTIKSSQSVIRKMFRLRNTFQIWKRYGKWFWKSSQTNDGSANLKKYMNLHVVSTIQ